VTSRRFRTLVLLLALAAPGLAAAQQRPAPLVRLSTPTITERPRVVGTLVETSADALTVRTGAGEEVVVPRSLIRRYEVSRGRAARGPAVRRAALAGLVLGAVVGAVFTPDHAEGESSKMVPYTFTGAALGALAGGVFGGVNRPERWERAELPAP
jgi:hypothetical protein